MDSAQLLRVLTLGPRLQENASKTPRTKGVRITNPLYRSEGSSYTEEEVGQMIQRHGNMAIERMRNLLIIPQSRDSGKKSAGMISATSSHASRDQTFDFGVAQLLDGDDLMAGDMSGIKRDNQDMMHMMMSRPGETDFDDPLMNMETESNTSRITFTQGLTEQLHHFMSLDEKDRIAEWEAAYNTEEVQAAQPRNRANHEPRRSKKVRIDTSIVQLPSDLQVQQISEKISISKKTEEGKPLIKLGMTFDKDQLIEPKILEELMKGVCNSDLDDVFGESILLFKGLDGLREKEMEDFGRKVARSFESQTGMQGLDERNYPGLRDSVSGTAEKMKSLEDSPEPKERPIPDGFFDIEPDPIANHLDTIAEENEDFLTTSNNQSSFPLNSYSSEEIENLQQQKEQYEEKSKEFKDYFDVRLASRSSFSLNYFMETKEESTTLEKVQFFAACLEWAQSGKIGLVQQSPVSGPSGNEFVLKEIYVQKA